MSWLRKPWVQAVLMLSLSAGIVLLVVRNQDLGGIWAQMQQADIRFILLAVALSAAGHWIRAKRWQSMLQAADAHVPTRDSFAALMAGYLASFAIPRLGELTRCASLLRQRAVPILTSAGTVFSERIIDVLVLGTLVFISLFNPKLDARLLLEWMFSAPATPGQDEKLILGCIILLGMALLGFLLVRAWRSGWLKRKASWLAGWGMQLRKGILAVFHLPSPAAFALETAGIWLCYWSGPVCTLAAMDMLTPGTIPIGWLGMSFAMFTMGSVARTLPLPAGSMGPYHFMVSWVLTEYGFSETQAMAAATLNHATQTGFFFLAGLVSVVYLSFSKANRQA